MMLIGRVVIGLAIAALIWLCAGRPKFHHAWEWPVYFGGVDVFIVVILLKVGWQSPIPLSHGGGKHRKEKNKCE